jgi:hypothetical protein
MLVAPGQHRQQHLAEIAPALGQDVLGAGWPVAVLATLQHAFFNK